MITAEKIFDVFFDELMDGFCTGCRLAKGNDCPEAEDIRCPRHYQYDDLFNACIDAADSLNRGMSGYEED